jgi:hypothetical protein
MPTYLIEVPMADAGAFELERATRMLLIVQSRMRAKASLARTTFAGVSREDGRLVYLVEAASLESARRMVSLALLPPRRIREIIDLSAADLLGARDPRGDADSGVESELVEDVVDVGLDGPLGQE